MSSPEPKVGRCSAQRVPVLPFNLHLPAPLRERLDAAARAAGLSAAAVVRRALDRYLGAAGGPRRRRARP